MKEDKNYWSFRIAFIALLLSTIILFFSNRSKTEEFFALFATIAVGLIYLYFKVEDMIEFHHKKARKLHLDK